MSLPIVIHDRTEAARGCGYRKPKGKYLVSGGVPRPCGKLPLELCVCPTCGAGIKAGRGWTWVDADALGAGGQCRMDADECATCPLGGRMGKAGLLWIGEKYYAKPGDWTAEAIRMGVSRRISQVPNEFKIGETWVLIAHRKAIERPCADCQGRGKTVGYLEGASCKCETCKGEGKLYSAGIFHAFKPTAIEYVVAGDESEDELRKLMARGFTLVRVHRDDGKPLVEDEGGDE